MLFERRIGTIVLKKFSSWSVSQKIATSFAFVIFTGSILLDAADQSATHFECNLFRQLIHCYIDGLCDRPVHRICP